VVPARCHCGAYFRPLLATFGTIRRVGVQSLQARAYRPPNITFINCTIDTCRVGIHMEGPSHAYIEGLTVLNTPVALELSGGATVDARGIYHSPGRPRQPAA
jgi:hypothetical protein